MKENWPRWQARIGSLKSWAVLAGILAVFGLMILGDELQTALNNPTEPQTVSIGELVREEIAEDRYVSIAGIAYYEMGYIETEDEKEVANVYPVIDLATGDMVFVRTTEPLPGVEHEAVTVTGMTTAAPDLLQTNIESDMTLIRDAGLTTTPNLYLAYAEKPGNVGGLILAIVGLVIVVALCLAVLFFPSTVFRGQPVDEAAAPASGELVTKATGRFQKLKQLEPSIEIGRGNRRFREANANLVPLEAQRLMVYIRYIQGQGVYGITLFRQKSDWAIMLDPSHTRAIEPGKLLGWRDRWGVRIQYSDAEGKPQALILTFDTAGAQLRFLQALGEMGFAAAAGAPQPPSVAPAPTA